MKTTNKLLPAIAFALACGTSSPALASGPRNIRVDQERLASLAASDQERVLWIADRLEAITAIDRATLDRNERRALRDEVRTLKNEADAYNKAAGGTVIYISGAGLILILILLIILL